MRCPNCDGELWKSAEGHDFKEGYGKPCVDDKGRRDITTGIRTNGIIATYECTRCESEFQWSSRTRRLTELRGPMSAGV